MKGEGCLSRGSMNESGVFWGNYIIFSIVGYEMRDKLC